MPPKKKAESKVQENFELSDAPNKRYETFFAKFKETEKVEPSKWKTVHLVAHFVKLYEEKFKIKYSFKFNAPPSRCYEVYQLNRLVGALGSKEPSLIKDYIDWIFTTKLNSNQYSFRVIGFLVNEKFIHEFKVTQKRSKQITRTTILPPSILQILEDLDIKSVHTYGDLAFLKQAADGDENYTNAFVQLNAAGFDSACLESVK